MATIKKFEDLFSWQRARELTKFVYSLTKKPEFSKDYGLKDQIQRAANSIMANQAEGFARGTKIELINYFYIAKGSAAEVKSHLYAAWDGKYISEAEFKKAYGLAEEAERLIQSFVLKVKAEGRQGIQYKPAAKKTIADEIKEMWGKEGFVQTIEGVMAKEEAEKRGLKPI